MTAANLPIRILIIDDDEEDFFITSEYIRKIRSHHLEIDWCSGYKEALGLICKGKYDIYFIDYYLGARTGLELLKESVATGCEQPLILLTGMGNRQIDMEAMQAGAYDYLIKTELNTEKLERCIRYSLERAATLKTLRESERKFRGFFERSRDAVFLAGEDLVFRDVNMAASEMFGYGRDALVRMSLYDFVLQDEVAARIRRALGDSGELEDHEVEFQTKTGDKICGVLSLSRERDARGETYVQGIVHDITDLRQAEKMTLQAEKLGAANRLARALAHEVRNPLNNINLSVDQLSQECEINGSEIYLDILRRNSKRINDLISELLTSSGASDAERTRERSPLQIILDESLASIMDRLTLKKVTWKVFYPKDPAYVLADRSRLRIAFTNIIINAVEAMQDAGGELNISVTSQNGHHLVSIRDNGTGISGEALPHLFEPYFTFKRNGLGLGLATSLNIIQSHRGSIDVQTGPEKGSNFICKLERA